MIGRPGAPTLLGCEESDVRSSRSAAAASRWSAATRCSTTTSSALTRKERPRVCFLPTASGDADHYIVRFYRAFDPARCEPSHVSLFRRERGAGGHARAAARRSDLIYVGGGSVISMLGAWRAHGLDATLRRAWERGVVMCGLSAGSLCWFAEAVSAFHGPPQRIDGLGLLPWSNCVHFDAEPERRRRLPRTARRRHGGGLRGRGRGRAALRGRAAGARGQLAGGGAGIPDALRPASRVSRRRWRPTTSGSRPRVRAA